MFCILQCAQCKNNILIQVVLGYGKPLVCDFPPRKMKTAPMMKFFISGAIPMSYYPDDTSWQVNRYIVNATVRGRHIKRVQSSSNRLI